MSIAVAWDVKQQTKQKNLEICVRSLQLPGRVSNEIDNNNWLHMQVNKKHNDDDDS